MCRPTVFFPLRSQDDLRAVLLVVKTKIYAQQAVKKTDIVFKYK